MLHDRGRRCRPPHHRRLRRAPTLTATLEAPTIVLRMTGEATNPLGEFVSRYLGDRRGKPTAVLHLGRETQAVSVRSSLDDAAWDIETVDVTDDPGDALGQRKPRSADVIVATTPILETDFPWVTALRIANILRPRGYACFSLDAGQTAGLSDSWFATLDGVVELTEWANLEALDLVSNRGGRLLVTRRPASAGLRGVINQLKLDVLRSVSLQESRRRVNHLRFVVISAARTRGRTCSSTRARVSSRGRSTRRRGSASRRMSTAPRSVSPATSTRTPSRRRHGRRSRPSSGRRG